MNKRKVAKKLYFDVQGLGRINAMPGSSFNLGGSTRAAVVADTGTVGFTEEPSTPNLKFKLPVNSGLSIKQINDLTDVDVTVISDSGQAYLFREAWRTGNPVEMSDGMIDVEMEAITAEEIK